MLAAVEARIMKGELGIPAPTPEERARKSITVQELGEKFVAEYASPKLKNPDEYRAEARSVLEVRVYPTLKDRPVASITSLDVERLT